MYQPFLRILLKRQRNLDEQNGEFSSIISLWICRSRMAFCPVRHGLPGKIPIIHSKTTSKTPVPVPNLNTAQFSTCIFQGEAGLVGDIARFGLGGSRPVVVRLSVHGGNHLSESFLDLLSKKDLFDPFLAGLVYQKPLFLVQWSTLNQWRKGHLDILISTFAHGQP